jgi:hypothetical protein
MVAEHDPKTDRTLSGLAQMARDVVAPTASIDDAPTSTVVTITQAQTVSPHAA